MMSGGIIFCFVCVFIVGEGALSNKYVEGDLRLEDGDTYGAGTVSVFRGYTWGRVCDDSWSIREANVVCRQLGHGFAVRALKRNHFHSKTGRFYFMDNVKCIGNETKLTECAFDGWARHDCSYGEDAGVQCAQVSKPRAKILWNPLKLDYSKEQLEKMRRVSFALSTISAAGMKSLINDTEAIAQLNSSIVEMQFEEIRLDANSGPEWERYLSSLTHEIEKTQIILIKPEGVSEAGAICPDHFTTMDAIVLCRQLDLGIGGKVLEMPMHRSIFPRMKHVAIIGHCYGNETDLSHCASYIDANGVKCNSPKAIAVECRAKLPDLLPDVDLLESSAHVQRLRLWHLECALEEHCFPDSVYTYIANNPGQYHWATRTLLRFSSITKNVGSGPFLPSLIPDHWEWHPCHAHYHSMKVFGRFEVTDSMNRLITYGHKASFCLEDNSCDRNVTKFFECSNVMDTKGRQGISPGCQDEYFFNYDCQWVDITDIPPGEYTYQVSYNPDFLVAEDNYFNNAVSCKLTYRGNWARFTECKLAHPYDLI